MENPKISFVMIDAESFIRTDADKLINENFIKWIKRNNEGNECMEVCMKADGCFGNFIDTHKISKLKNPNSYNKLNKYYESN